jgi:hypothetical protein
VQFRVVTRRSVIAKARFQSLTIPSRFFVDKRAKKQDSFPSAEVLAYRYQSTNGLYSFSSSYNSYNDKQENPGNIQTKHVLLYILYILYILFSATSTETESATHDYKKKGSNEFTSAYFGYSIWCYNKDKGRPNMP